MTPSYCYNAKIVNVVDGDTVDLNVDLGFRIWMRMRARVLGVNCPELKGETREAGQRAKEFTQRWTTRPDRSMSFTIQTHLDKTDSFGRILAEIWDGDKSLSYDLLASGNAVPFMRER